MKANRAYFLLGLYKFLGQILTPFLWLLVMIRAMKGKEEWSRRGERFGRASVAAPKGKVIWLHAASVGETAALVPLIYKLKNKSLRILLTTGTVTAAAFAVNRFGHEIIHQYAPLDTKGALRRFFRHWDIGCALICESEIWPMRILLLHENSIPQILVNAHLSERSYNKWYHYLDVAKQVFSRLDLVLAQTKTDAHYYYALGAPSVQVVGNLKAEVLPEIDLDFLEQYQPAFEKRILWGALSTHHPEEEMVAEVHKALKTYIPNLLTVLVPRHPERCGAIEKQLQEKGLQVMRRSTNMLPDAQTDIFLGDSIGEMGTYISFIEVAFMGKSLGAKGGHNPIEPALIGAAILTGPYTENFSNLYEELLERKGAMVVSNATDLACSLHKLLTDSEARAAIIEKAQKLVQEKMGALSKTVDALDPFLQSLMMQAVLSEEKEEHSVV